MEMTMPDDVKPIVRPRPPSVRLSPATDEVQADLGFLAELAGNWHGHGFNLIARPDHDGGGPLFLELNQTEETLKIDPIASPVPNRGFVESDITLFGLTYLQKISDSVTGGALHIEPGIWITQPAIATPPEQPPNDGQIIARMATIPHGNSLLAQGSAINLNPLPGGTFQIAPVNTAPFAVGAPMKVGGTQGGFPAYNLADTSAAAVNFRTPFGNIPQVALPAEINGVPMQTVINDPTRLLQAAIKDQVIEKMVVLTIATEAVIAVEPPGTAITTLNGAGGIENIPFLLPNANTATVFATFWIETIRHGTGSFLQLQYVQTVLLNFPILGVTPVANLSWPHVSVATLRKTFG
jgi:hypothetical protein